MCTQYILKFYAYYSSEVRSKYSRRRRFDPDADVDFINEKNRKLNARLEYFYGKYTREIKQNLERGTAVWSLCILLARELCIMDTSSCILSRSRLGHSGSGTRC